jgi:hypothetical protein
LTSLVSGESSVSTTTAYSTPISTL